MFCDALRCITNGGHDGDPADTIKKVCKEEEASTVKQIVFEKKRTKIHSLQVSPILTIRTRTDEVIIHRITLAFIRLGIRRGSVKMPRG